MNLNIIKGFAMIVMVLFSFFIAQPMAFAEDSSAGQSSGIGNMGMSQGDCSDSLSPNIDVKDSLILSIASLCLPGIVENLYQYQQIKCEEVVCKYEALSNELDPTFCSDIRSYQTCTYVVGEMFAVAPFGQFLEQMREGIASYLSNPAAFGIGLIRNQIEQRVMECSGSCDSPMVTAATVLLATTNLVAAAERISRIIDRGLDFGDQRDFCSEIDDIQDEIDDILR